MGSQHPCGLSHTVDHILKQIYRTFIHHFLSFEDFKVFTDIAYYAFVVIKKKRKHSFCFRECFSRIVILDCCITELDKESENKFKLLVIDDSKDIRSYLNTIFRYEYNVILAENGKDGFNLALRELPDLIITDIKMPVMDGMEFCRLLKGNINTYHLPVILLSAMDEEGDIVRGIELGADDYILKPFNYKILKSKVRNLINSRNELRHKYSQIFTEDKQEEEKAPQKEMFEAEPFIKNLINIITENKHNEHYRIKKLTKNLNMSQPTLYRRIKQHTNFTIIELIRYVRLKKSSELLKEKSYSVQEVALMVGYNDVPTFRKHFIDFYGITLSNFMKDTVEQ